MDFVSSHQLQPEKARAVWPGLALDNSYARLPQTMHSKADLQPLAEPKLLWFNAPLARALGLAEEPRDAITAFASGRLFPFGSSPIRRKIARRPWGALDLQHGSTSEIALGEHIDPCFQRHDLSLLQREESHAHGETDLSVNSAVQQLLMGEVLHATGVQAPRILAIAYDNASSPLERARASAIKVDESPLTIGAFEHAFRKRSLIELSRLGDYAIARINPVFMSSHTPYTDLLEHVCDQFAVTMAQWASVGFIHSRLDTHLTPIDGGMSLVPYSGFMDHYDPDCIKHPLDWTGRYTFSAQPIAAHWNLCRLANALGPLTRFEQDGSGRRIQNSLDDFFNRYEFYRSTWFRHKLSLRVSRKGDTVLVNELIELMAADRANPALVFHQIGQLATRAEGRDWLVTQFRQRDRARQWVDAYLERLAVEPASGKPEHRDHMQALNPWCIPGSRTLSATIDKVVQGYAPAIDQFLAVYGRRA